MEDIEKRLIEKSIEAFIIGLEIRLPQSHWL